MTQHSRTVVKSAFRRLAVLVTLAAAAAVLAGSHWAAACVWPARTPVDEIVTQLLADGPDELDIVAIVEFETVRDWPALEEYTAGSVSVATRVWGNAAGSYRARYLGGEYVGASATTSTCGSSLARPIGSRDYFFVHENHPSLNPISEHELTANQEAALVSHLGAAQVLPLPIVSDEFPLPDRTSAVGNAAESPGPNLWLVVALASAMGGFVLVLVAFRRPREIER